MSVSLSSSKVQYTTNGSLVDFDFTFGILESSDLTVIYTDPDGVDTTLTETTHYTVTATGTSLKNGGRVTTVATYPSGGKITLMRAVPITQEMDFTEGMPTLYETFEDGLDKLTMVAQQNHEELTRCIIAPASETMGTTLALPSASARANQWLAFDSDGNVITSPGQAGDVPATEFGADLIQCADATEATTLLLSKGTARQVLAMSIADWIEATVRSIGIPTAVAGGTADAITADFTPNVALTNGTTVIVRAGAANTTTTPTFAPDGLTAKTIVKGNNLPLAAGDIAGAGHWLEMQFDSELDEWVLQNPYSTLVFASADENAAGTIENKAVDPLGIREAFNATGSAPVYACRAWVNFNGTGTVAIRASGNVSSITDNGVGIYTVNFTTAMQDENFAVSVNMMRQTTGSTGDTIEVECETMTTGSVKVRASGSERNFDPEAVFVAIFR